MARQNKKPVPKQKSFWKRCVKYRSVILMSLPGMIAVFIFSYIPMYGILIAFQDYNPVEGMFGHNNWVGFKYFKQFLQNPYLFRLIRNTLLLGIYTLLWSFPAPIIFALLMDQLTNAKFKKTVQSISYLPYFISTVVIVGLVKDFCSVDGVINGIREFFGLNAVSFMTDPKYFRTIFIASNLWQGLGWGAIVYLAALSGVDPQLHEAATLDGANRWQRIRYVSWPAIVPTTTIMLILESGKIISSDFTKVLLLYNESTYETADIIGNYVYREGILGGKFEYTTAIGLLTSLFSFILLITANFLSKKISENSLW